MPLLAKPVGVLGAGPVGSMLAANLAKAGQEVVLIEVLPERCDQLDQVGLVVTGKQSISARPTAVLRSLAALKGQPLSALFICTKTWALRKLLPELAPVVDADAMVIAFQNGIGPEDELANHFPRERVARGIANFAGNVVKETGSVTMHWFTPPNYLGPLDEANGHLLGQLADTLNSVGFTSHAVSCHEIKRQAFYKTILNSALNALCADAGITMRQAMTYPHTRSLANILVREGLSVAAAVGYNYGEDARDKILRYLDEGGDHLPSMWMDLQRGSMTEIEYINGKIAKMGLMFKNLDVDVNLFFTAMIVTQELKSGARTVAEIPDYLRHF